MSEKHPQKTHQRHTNSSSSPRVSDEKRPHKTDRHREEEHHEAIQTFQWSVDVYPHHVSPLLFSIGCLVLGGSAVYFYTFENYFAVFLFLIFIVFFTLHQALQTMEELDGEIDDRGILLNNAFYYYDEIDAFAVVDEESFFLYPEEDSRVRMYIHADDFEEVYHMLSVMIEEVKYEEGFFETIHNRMSP